MITIKELGRRLDVESDLMISIVRESLTEFNGQDIFEDTQLNKEQFNKIINRGSTEKAIRVKEEVNEEYFTEALIAVRCEGEKQLVSARELHKGLEIGTEFTDWMPRMIEYGFVENIDYTSVWFSKLKNDFAEFNGNVRSMSARGYSIDYIISLDMAKHIAMIQRSELGMKFRNYFIKCEKKMVSQEQQMLELLGSIYNGGQEGVAASKQLTEIEVKKATTPLLATIEEQKPIIDEYNDLMGSDGLTSLDDLAKMIGVGKNKMLSELRAIGILREDTKKYGGKVYRNENHNMPYSSFMKYFELKVLGTNEYTGKIDKKLYVNAKGIRFIKKRLGC